MNELMEKEEKTLEMELSSTNTKDIFCSFKTDSVESKKKLYNTLEKADLLLKDCVNQEIELKDVYVSKRKIADEKTGELKDKFRIILFDKTGKTYATGSYGIYNSLVRLFRSFGLPSNWNECIKIKIVNVSGKDNKNLLSIKLI